MLPVVCRAFGRKRVMSLPQPAQNCTADNLTAKRSAGYGGREPKQCFQALMFFPCVSPCHPSTQAASCPPCYGGRPLHVKCCIHLFLISATAEAGMVLFNYYYYYFPYFYFPLRSQSQPATTVGLLAPCPVQSH